MVKVKYLAAFAVLAALAGCVQGQGQGINANCALMGAAGGAALGAVTDNDIATTAIVGGALGAGAGATGMCQ